MWRAWSGLIGPLQVLVSDSSTDSNLNLNSTSLVRESKLGPPEIRRRLVSTTGTATSIVNRSTRT